MSYFEKIKQQAQHRTEQLEPINVHGINFHVAKVASSEVESMQADVLNKSGKVDPLKMKGFRARYLAACLRDPEDLEARLKPGDIFKWDNQLVQDVFREAKRTNGEDLEEAEKNSPETDD